MKSKTASEFHLSYNFNGESCDTCSGPSSPPAVQPIDQTGVVSIGGAMSPPEYFCESAEYLSVKAQAEDYNAKNTDGPDMPIPSCKEGENYPYCDSEEHQREKALARETGSPVGPCRARGKPEGTPRPMPRPRTDNSEGSRGSR